MPVAVFWVLGIGSPVGSGFANLLPLMSGTPTTCSIVALVPDWSAVSPPELLQVKEPTLSIFVVSVAAASTFTVKCTTVVPPAATVTLLQVTVPADWLAVHGLSHVADEK